MGEDTAPVGDSEVSDMKHSFSDNIKVKKKQLKRFKCLYYVSGCYHPFMEAPFPVHPRKQS